MFSYCPHYGLIVLVLVSVDGVCASVSDRIGFSVGTLGRFNVSVCDSGWLCCCWFCDVVIDGGMFSVIVSSSKRLFR